MLGILILIRDVRDRLDKMDRVITLWGHLCTISDDLSHNQVTYVRTDVKSQIQGGIEFPAKFSP